MKIFHAGMRLEVLAHYAKLYPDVRLNILKSYANTDQMSDFCRLRKQNQIAQLILDSGTYTKNHTGKLLKRVNVQSYKSYLLDFADSFDWYFNFDSDFSGESNINYQNQLELETAGLKPVPVVHDIQGDEIEHFIRTGHKIIALGSRQITNQSSINTALEKFAGTDVKVHLLGNVSIDLITCPIYSCDTSAHAMRGSYGYIYYWNSNKEGIDQTDRIYIEEYLSTEEKGIRLSDYEHRREFLTYLKKNLQVAEADLYGSEGAFYKQLANLHYYVQLERVVNEIHRVAGFAE